MTEIPTGTVTFFFSDIEGSTKMLQRLGPGYPPVLQRHGEIVRSALDEHGGIELGTEGDSFFAVFRTAREAVEAAATVQRRLAAEAWPDGGTVRVRIGLHTGEGVLGAANYVGLDVHRAARIAAAGHGGQVVVSDTTKTLASDAAVIDLGIHRLKDLEEPEHLYQVVITDLPASFPPLRSLDARPNNLPTFTTRLVGRDEETAQLLELLEDHRLLTITGIGGIGKTRLAINVAAAALPRFTDGAFFIDLSSVTDASLVLPAIASELHVDESEPGGVGRALGSGTRLLVLDNFEQVVTAAPTVGELLAAATGVRVLTTSQVPLRIGGERVFRLDPLATDGDGDRGARPAAVELFAARAAGADPTFSLTDHEEEVNELVAALGGLPLALELAAARVNVLTPAEILERLAKDSDLLATRAADAPVRHRSLRAAIAWSYELLSPDQRSTLRALTVFRGGAAMAALEAVVERPAIDDLAELVDRSLVTTTTASGKRFDLLESVRHFAAAESDPVETAGWRQRHTDYFVELGCTAEKELVGNRVDWWLAALADEHENLQATMGRLLEAHDVERGFDLLGRTWRYFQGAGRLGEAALWLDRFFQLARPEPSPSAPLARALMARGAVAYWRGQFDGAATDYRRAVDVSVEVADRHLEADAWYGLGTSLGNDGRLEEGDAALNRAREIYEEVGDTEGEASVLVAGAFSTAATEGLAAVVPLLEEAAGLWEASGRPVQASQTYLSLAGAALDAGDFSKARSIALHGLDLAGQAGDRFGAAWALEWVAAALVAMGDVETGALLAGAVAAAQERMGADWTAMKMGIDDARDRLVATLGEAEADRAMEGGSELSLEEAAEIARGTA